MKIVQIRTADIKMLIIAELIKALATATVLLVALGYHINVGMFVGLGISLLFVAIGNVMGKFNLIFLQIYSSL
ncbi:hypothetical protein [Clostridium tagluense]|uniref:hypothetical protein n=1 Tax=Clostridium tagluense TaxID=360422 RepID=UPI001C0E1977|nr:hypothetical protein [Clostridium tagluense]MBU3130710.1 hypothetical protein [Clostridium tagluense]